MVQCQEYVAADGHMIQPRGSRSIMWFKVKSVPKSPYPTLATGISVSTDSPRSSAEVRGTKPLLPYVCLRGLDSDSFTLYLFYGFRVCCC